MLHTINLYSDVCQLGLNKTGKSTHNRLPSHPTLTPTKIKQKKTPEKETLNEVSVLKSCWVHMTWWSHKHGFIEKDTWNTVTKWEDLE